MQLCEYLVGGKRCCLTNSTFPLHALRIFVLDIDLGNCDTLSPCLLKFMPPYRSVLEEEWLHSPPEGVILDTLDLGENA